MGDPIAGRGRLHVACIMDGNGRWAGRRGLPRTDGHTEGEENLARLVRVAVHARHRLAHRVRVLDRELDPPARRGAPHPRPAQASCSAGSPELNELNVRIQWIGRPFDSPDARTPKYVQRAIRKAIADTAGNTGMLLTVAFDYGARGELIDAVRRLRADGRAGDARRRSPTHLYLPELPPVDVLVRTCGERRVSNFLLWQAPGRPSTSPTRPGRTSTPPSSTPRSRSSR